MSKITNAFIMLDLLSSGKKYTAKELAHQLAISERMVRYYKEQLELSGIFIESFKGPGGGYFINKSIYSPYKQFNKYELQVLKEVQKIVNDTENFQFKEEYSKLINKMTALFNIEEEKRKYNWETEEIEEKEDLELYEYFQQLIKNKKRIKIAYLDIDGGEWSERSIHPCQIFKYEETYYITAFCEFRNSVRHFRLDRIRLI